tara:strand:- start:1079 stop:2380 length:1302 start_codon:yes stop_codon:yes gene_type:complete
MSDIQIGPALAGGQETRYLRYALFILFLAHTLNFIDRQIINILAHPIQQELGLNDTQLGLMTGLAFALFYSVLGIPIARYSDRPKSHRPAIIALSLVIWSGMTALSGLAQNFVQLILARIGVGVGEAGCTPAAHSLIGDYFAKERRASAIAIYGLGLPVGGLLGMIIGGTLADAYGWRSALFAVGIPGVILSVVVLMTLREPRRELPNVIDQPSLTPRASLIDGMKELLKIRSFRYVLAGASLLAMLSYGKTTWATILFARVHGLTPGQIGVWYGVSVGVAGMIGMWLGGRLGDHYGGRDVRNYFIVPAIAILVTTPLLCMGYLHSDWRWALFLIFAPSVASSLYYGPTFAAIQRLVPLENRATAVATLLLFANLVGAGLGPLFFGILSDALAPVVGIESVRWVLVFAALLGVAAAGLYWKASRSLELAPTSY